MLHDAAAAMLQLALRAMLDFFGLIRMKRFMHHIHRPEAGSAKAGKRGRSAR